MNEMKPVPQLKVMTRYRAPFGSSPTPQPTPPHHIKVELLIGGAATFEVNGEDRAVGEGALLWHLPGELTVHRNDWENPYECLAILFDCGGEPLKEVPRYSEWRGEPSARRWALELLQHYHRDPVSRPMLGEYAYTTLRLKAHLHSLEKPIDNLPLALQRALAFMNAHASEAILLSEIADRAGVSAPHLHLLFRTHLGTSPHRALIEKRLQAARERLVTGDAPIKGIASDCGIPDPANFTRAFKKRFGATPAAYRRRYYGQNP